MQINYEETLLAIRLVNHFLTAVVVASYFHDGLPKRPMVSICAWLLAASSAALAMQVLTQWAELREFSVQPWQCVFSGSVLALVIMCRGNVGRLIPRQFPTLSL